MSDNFMNKKFYVYMYSDPETRLPFYIGKGSERRYLKHLSYCRNPHLKNKIAKIRTKGLEPIVEKFYWTDNEQNAYDVEEHFIKLFGIKSTNGILCNQDIGTRGSKLYEFDDEFYSLLGKMSDMSIAKKYGCSSGTVFLARKSRGIQDFKSSGKLRAVNRINFEDSHVAMMGTVPDRVIAELLGTTKTTVANRRNELGIPKFSKRGSIVADGTVHFFKNINTDESFQGTVREFSKHVGASFSYVNTMMRGVLNSVKGGWVIDRE